MSGGRYEYEGEPPLFDEDFVEGPPRQIMLPPDRGFLRGAPIVPIPAEELVNEYQPDRMSGSSGRGSDLMGFSSGSDSSYTYTYVTDSSDYQDISDVSSGDVYSSGDSSGGSGSGRGGGGRGPWTFDRLRRLMDRLDEEIERLEALPNRAPRTPERVMPAPIQRTPSPLRCPVPLSPHRRWSGDFNVSPPAAMRSPVRWNVPVEPPQTASPRVAMIPVRVERENSGNTTIELPEWFVDQILGDDLLSDTVEFPEWFINMLR